MAPPPTHIWGKASPSGGVGQNKAPIVPGVVLVICKHVRPITSGTEISIYLNQDYQSKGLGSLLTRWMLTQAPSLGIRNVIALVFAHNHPSLGLFRKLGFEQWGYMPEVCDMEGFIADVVMLGKAVTSDDILDKAPGTI